MEMTKKAVKAALNIDTDADLARQFTPSIGRWAVGQWPDDKPIPSARQWELRAKFPDIFGTEPGGDHRALLEPDGAGSAADVEEMDDTLAPLKASA